MVQDIAISSKFSTPRVSQPVTMPKFQKHFVFRKMAAIFNFQQKHKIAYISLTVWDRERFHWNFQIRVSEQDTLPKFQKFFLNRKMAAVLNFWILVHVYICSAWTTMTLENICICIYIYIFAEYFASLSW